MTIHSVFGSARDNSLEFLTTHLSNNSEWMDYSVQCLKGFSKKLYEELSIKASVCIAANLLFFAKISELAELLEERIKTTQKKLEAREIRFNMILIDYFVVGGSALTFNIVLSKLMNYPLSKLTLATITLGSIALRTFSHQPTIEAAEETKEAVEQTKIPALKPHLPPKETDKNKEVEQKKLPAPPLSPPKVKRKKVDTPPKEELFIHDFCNEISLALKNVFNYVKFDHEHVNAQLIFLDKLKQNFATIEGEGDLCRAVNLPIQAAFEKLLCTMLKNGQITQVKALYLTPLPCTSLRTPFQKIDVKKEVEWKKWTVDIRTQTVRALRDEGATILVSYNAANYEALPDQSSKGIEEFDTYENEKQKQQFYDLPLLEEIPEDLSGALYFINDANHNTYILATQGVQIQDEDKTPTESWKMWFGLQTDPEINARSKEMIDCVSKDHPHIIFIE